MDMRKRIGSITLPCWTPGLNQDKTSPWVPSLESLQSSVEWSTLSDALLKSKYIFSWLYSSDSVFYTPIYWWTNWGIVLQLIVFLLSIFSP